MFKKSYNENIQTISNKKANKKILRKFAELIQYLRFESFEINVLKEYLYSTMIMITDILSKSVFVIIDCEKIKNQKYGFPRKRIYIKDSGFFYLNNIYNSIIERDEDFTFFFICRSVFFAFYNKHF